MVAVLQPLAKGKYIAIDRAVVLVGRSADCDAVITTSKKISRRHCCLVQVDELFYVRDLGSMNGVWLNGSRVNREARIGHGDKIAIGDVEYLFHPNARIEQKATVAPMAPQEATDNKADTGPNRQQPAADDASAEVIHEEQFEIVGEVVDLNDDMVETNELEIINEPIVDDGDDDDYVDEVVVYED